MKKTIKLQQLNGLYAVSRLASVEPIPDWADGSGFVTISRDNDALSIVCRQERVPVKVQSDRDWTCLKFIGPFAFDETGIVLSVIQPLSEGGIGIFVVSTFDGDHLMVKSADLACARSLLLGAGHTILSHAE
jgi:uncharacterized protein